MPGDGAVLHRAAPRRAVELAFCYIIRRPTLGGVSAVAIRVNDHVVIPRDELTFRATRAGGPGGQHVNTSSTRVELSWNLNTSRALDDALRERARARLGNRLDADGVLRVTASETRSQLRNREAAERRLAELMRSALRAPRPRIATRPSKAVKQKRLDAKRKRGEKKKARRRPDLEE